MIRNNRGSQSIEMLFVLPLILMLFFMVVEMGFIMYDFVAVNYIANSMAVQAATQGCFTQDIRDSGANYIRTWTTGGHNIGINASATIPAPSENTAVIWGPSSGQKFNRGQMIEVGIIYPIKFKTFVMKGLSWMVDEEKLYLRSNASAMSEIFIE